MARLFQLVSVIALLQQQKPLQKKRRLKKSQLPKRAARNKNEKRRMACSVTASMTSVLRP